LVESVFLVRYAHKQVGNGFLAIVQD
jgi:hypothetical protein